MTALDFISQFQFNQFTITRLLEDVSHEDSLHEVQAGINNINFLVGHLVLTRDGLLKMLKAQPVLKDTDAVLYGSKPKTFTNARAKPVGELKAAVEESYTRLQTALKVSESSFSKPAERKFIREGEQFGDQIGFFICHEEYHIGQIGLIRRLIGKPGLF
jgi:uncharacterized damage-inducible protein DinB